MNRATAPRLPPDAYLLVQGDLVLVCTGPRETPTEYCRIDREAFEAFCRPEPKPPGRRYTHQPEPAHLDYWQWDGQTIPPELATAYRHTISPTGVLTLESDRERVIAVQGDMLVLAYDRLKVYPSVGFDITNHVVDD